MFSFILSLIACGLFIYLTRKEDSGIPVCPGSLPIIGHLHLFMGDTIRFYENFKKLSMDVLSLGGCGLVNLGPFKFYVICDPDDASSVLRSCLKKQSLYKFAKPWVGEGLITADVKQWLKNRTVLYPIFAPHRVSEYIGVFNNQAKKLVEKLTPYESKGSFDLEPLVSIVGLETACQTSLGVEVGKKLANLTYMEAIDGNLNVILQRFQRFWLHLNFIYSRSGLKKRQDQYVNYIQTRTAEAITKHKEKGVHEKDNDSDFEPFITSILNAAHRNNFTDKQIKDEVNSLIPTAYETTPSVLLYALMCIGHHQDVQQKVYDEIQTILDGSDRDLNKEDLSKLVYLEAVLKETLRLYTLVPILARQTTTELKLKNFTIPKNSSVLISCYGLHRHSEWGPDAEQFRPERWLEPERPISPHLFTGFGLGRRYCIGKLYAMLNMKTAVVHLLRRWIVSADVSKLQLQFKVLLKPAEGQSISLTKRLP